jgi:hypothetical protein
LIEIGQLVLKIFKNFQCIFTLLLLSPLGERQSSSFEKFRIPSPMDDLCQVWLKLAHGSGEEVENVNVYIQTDGKTDDRQRAIRIAHLSFQLS